MTNQHPKEDGLLLVDLPLDVRQALAAQAEAYSLDEEEYASRLLRATVENLAHAQPEDASEPEASAQEDDEAPAREAQEDAQEHGVTPAEEMCSAAHGFKACRQLMDQILAKFEAYGFDVSEDNRENFHTLIDHLCETDGLATANRALEHLGHTGLPSQSEDREDSDETESQRKGMVGSVLAYLKGIHPDGEDVAGIESAVRITRKQVRECLSVLKKQGGAEKLDEDDLWFWTGDEGVSTHTTKVRFEDTGAIEAVQKLHAMGVVYAAGTQIANGMGRAHNTMSGMLQSLERRGVITRDGMFPTGGIRWRIDPDELAEWVEKQAARVANKALYPEVDASLDGDSKVETNWEEVLDNAFPPETTEDIERKEEDAAAEEARIFEELRLAEEAEAGRKADLGRKAEAERTAALEAEKEARRIARETLRLAAEGEKAQLAEELRQAAEETKLEAARQAEADRKAEEAEASRLAQESATQRKTALAAFNALVIEYNTAAKSKSKANHIGSEYQKAVKEDVIRVHATALDLRPKTDDLNTEGWLAQYLYTQGDSFDLTVRHKLFRLGVVSAGPVWVALDHGMSYKQAWKVLSRLKRAKKKGTPTSVEFIQKLVDGVLNPVESSPGSQEDLDAESTPSPPTTGQKTADHWLLADAPEPVIKPTPWLNTGGSRLLKINLPDSEVAPVLRPLTQEEEAEEQGLKNIQKMLRIRREIVMTFVEAYNKPMNNRQLITAVGRMFPKAKQLDVVAELNALIREGLVITASKKGYFTLDKGLVLDVMGVVEARIKAANP